MARKSTPRLPIARGQAVDFRRRLLRWFRRHGRDLPWRRTRDPYHILVSEFMLQQTQVSRVEAYYQRFLERYPSVESLAAAPRRRCGRAGPGWGTTGGRPISIGWPGRSWRSTPASSRPIPRVLVDLPGIGRYTAGAVASFAYERSDAGHRHQRGAGHPPRVPSPARAAWRGPAAVGDRRRDRAPATASGPGRSTRRSWSSARWSAPPGSLDAASVRSGARARRGGEAAIGRYGNRVAGSRRSIASTRLSQARDRHPA